MQYLGTSETEMIWLGTEDSEHYIELVEACDEPIFYVRACCDHSWVYKFDYSVSNYSMVKHTIMDAAFECDYMEELMDLLDDVFVENFDDIIVYDEDEYDDCCCDECNRRN